MDTTTKILIVGGVLNIAYGTLLGLPIALIRQNQPTYSRYLRLAHVSALLWGPILISLAAALPLSRLSDGLEQLAAWLLVAASILGATKDTLNWRLGITDEFAHRRSLPFLLGTLGAIGAVVGIVLISIGVVIGVVS